MKHHGFSEVRVPCHAPQMLALRRWEQQKRLGEDCQNHIARLQEPGSRGRVGAMLTMRCSNDDLVAHYGDDDDFKINVITKTMTLL